MKKTITICDSCGAEVDTQGGYLRLNYYDGRRGSKYAELCSGCAEKIPGQPVARRGRKRKEEVQEP